LYVIKHFFIISRGHTIINQS